MLPFDLNIFPRRKGVYLVGGSIRDLLCKRLPMDYDLAVQDDCKTFARQLASRVAGHLVEFGQPGHPILRVVSAGFVFDIMPLNGICIEDDLQQRDFTINAMALDLSSGNLIDPVNGRIDLAAKRIRMVSPEVFKSDPVRLVRAYRMAAALEFSLDADTEAAISRQADWIRKSAVERVREEFFKILQSAGSHAQLARMAHSGLLFSVFPEFRQLNDDRIPGHRGLNLFEQTLNAYSHLEKCFDSGYSASGDGGCLFFAPVNAARTVLVKWAVLFHQIGKPQSQKAADDGTLKYYGHAARSAVMARQICERLRFARRQTDQISFMIRFHRRPISLFKLEQKTGATDRAFIRFFIQCGDAVPAILLLGLAEFLGRRGGANRTAAEFTEFVLARIRQYDTVLRPRAQEPPPLNGHDLIQEFGLKPSAEFKRILKRIAEAHLAAGGLTRHRAIKLVQHLLDRR